METTRRWWGGVLGLAPWFALDAWLHGAALFVLLVLLSARFVSQGFGGVRQHALAPDGGKWILSAPSVRRSWWRCTCASRAACECLKSIGRQCAVAWTNLGLNLRAPSVLRPAG